MEEARPATVFISVDVPREYEESALVGGIQDVLRRHQACSMWSFEFRGPAKVIRVIRAASNEFGLLATEDWANPVVGRSSFARELSARMTCAAGMGIEPMALALSCNDSPSHFDLLVKHRLAIVRTRTDVSSGSANSLQPRLSRYGIWQAEPTLVIPVSSRWTLPWTSRRLLQQAIDRSQTVHVAVDARSLARNISAGLLSLDYFLKLANVRRESGLLQIVSAKQLLDIYHPRRERITSRSILRAA